jgi:four helix bundle protein
MGMGLEQLTVWTKSKEFALSVYRLVIPALPIEEKWAMATQLRRSAASVPANIAEGYGRYYFQDNIRFCYIARGSLQEVVSHLSLCLELGYINYEVFEELSQQARQILQLLNGYIAYLKRSKHGENEPGSFTSIAEETAPYDISEEPLDDDQ